MNRRFGLFVGACLVLGAILTARAEAAGDASGGGTRAEPRIMFVALHVADLTRSLEFYTGILGMREYQRYPGPDHMEVALTYAARVSEAQPTDSGTMLLLVHRTDDAAAYRHGNALSRIAIGVTDVGAAVAAAAKAGQKVIRQPTTIEEGGLTVGFVEDPDGFVLELIEVK
ncbi:MAG: VOC family protein [Deltaproteobacteria bacterium]|nr:VOC family protein [Deltaproteobacteria bacterium]MBW2363243.1 VOC family protein [Deltaproteobacteria bacterium]